MSNLVEIEGTPRVYLAHLDSWSSFWEQVRGMALMTRRFVWRGQRRCDWRLESTLDRIRGDGGRRLSVEEIEGHLDRFRLASRGRLQSPPPMEEENEWWAIGQHQGLSTPLLDWTTSPFVALYFAFDEKDDATSVQRAVYGVNRDLVEQIGGLIRSDEPPGQVLEFFTPRHGENARLLSQGGLFSRCPSGVTVVEWMHANAVRLNTMEDGRSEDDELPPEPLFVEIRIRNVQREDCLVALNRMNINRLSLFPDLYGAAGHCNRELEIRDY